MPTALISVSDKTGIADFARGLAALGWKLISTGGTAKALRDAGINVRDVSEVTNFPEMLDGRVKTLHPAVHGAILARRDLPEHARALVEHHIEPIDLVAVNLYPFEETAGRTGAKPEDIIEQIDIGGPSMLRSAAKNFAWVTVIVDPADYGRVLAALQAGDDDLDLRRLLAEKAFARTAAYDAAIAYWFGCERSEIFPERIAIPLERATMLRYG
ncbi:MAG TPA: bifunctional phosphoribosylaminoimidazolecarboxamide formyltransferase/IMP cyclohydrolase, partial [Gemmatimonadaceae bacterium]|nr:bifunctional phosphoribosylaminoimidazolecarboxamide formyltransferase/IMP cyclohydrolase [Gemmatimonadaceae bacterium]